MAAVGPYRIAAFNAPNSGDANRFDRRGLSAASVGGILGNSLEDYQTIMVWHEGKLVLHYDREGEL